MKTLKNLIITYFFGFLTAAAVGASMLYFWWYAVSVALKNTEIDWLYQGFAFMLIAFVAAFFTDKFENRLDD